MDRHLRRQETIEPCETAPRRRGLALCNVPAATFDERSCWPEAIGHPRGRVGGRQQIVYGLVSLKTGPPSLSRSSSQHRGPSDPRPPVRKLRQRFRITRVSFVGARGMLTRAHLHNDVVPAGLDYLTAVRAPEMRCFVTNGAIQLSLFDETNPCEISCPDYRGKRLVAAKSLLLAVVRARRREPLLMATKAELATG